VENIALLTPNRQQPNNKLNAIFHAHPLQSINGQCNRRRHKREQFMTIVRRTSSMQLMQSTWTVQCNSAHMPCYSI